VGWVLRCKPSCGGTAAPALPGRPASHSRFATAIAKETYHTRACLSRFLTSGLPGCQPKKGDTGCLLGRCSSFTRDRGFREWCWPGKLGATAFARGARPGSGRFSNLLPRFCYCGPAQMPLIPQSVRPRSPPPPTPIPLREPDAALLQKGTAAPQGPLPVRQCLPA